MCGIAPGAPAFAAPSLPAPAPLAGGGATVGPPEPLPLPSSAPAAGAALVQAPSGGGPPEPIAMAAAGQASVAPQVTAGGAPAQSPVQAPVGAPIATPVAATAPEPSAVGCCAPTAPSVPVPAQVTPSSAPSEPATADAPAPAPAPPTAAPAPPVDDAGIVEQSVDDGPERAPAPPTELPPIAQPETSTGNVRQRIVQLAQQELGRHVSENAGSNRDSGGQIVKYRSAVSGPGENPNAPEPWCADFASWIMREAGVPIGPNGQGEDYVTFLKQWGQAQGRWHARAGYTPQPGDMIIYDWRGDGHVDHVGIVTGVEAGRVNTIAGNERDAVTAATRSLGDGAIAGYITPG